MLTCKTISLIYFVPYGGTLPPNRQAEFCHRYMLGLYKIIKTVTDRFPNIPFEGCGGGGGRFDPSMLACMSQSWASDSTRGPKPVTAGKRQNNYLYLICRYDFANQVACHRLHLNEIDTLSNGRDSSNITHVACAINNYPYN